VCGRELFAELGVVTLDDDAVLAVEWRDCGFRIEVTLLEVLWCNGNALGAVLCVWMALVDCMGRYDALFPRGLEARRRSRSFSFSVIFTRTGEGESSIIRTQPELSPVFLSFDLSDATLSWLVLFPTLRVEVESSVLGLGKVGVPMLGRLVVLPIRSLGTRV